MSVFDGEFYSVPQIAAVDLVSRNDQPPVLYSPHMVYNFTENGPPVFFDSIFLTDADSNEDDRKAIFVEVSIADQRNEPDEVLFSSCLSFCCDVIFIYSTSTWKGTLLFCLLVLQSREFLRLAWKLADQSGVTFF